MKDLFDFRNIERVIKEEIPKGRGRYGIPNYAAGILIALFSYFTLMVLAIVSSILVYESLPAGYSAITVKPALTQGFFISSLIYFGFILFPYLMIGSLIYQGFIYAMLMLLGGKGNFRKQYFITSYIALALGIGTLGFLITLIFIFFLPCVNLFFLLIYAVAALYLVLYVQGKMLVALHRTSLLLAVFIILITTLGSIAAFVGVNLIVGHFGLLPDFTSSFSIVNESMLNLSMPQITPANISDNITNMTNSTG